MRRAQFCRQPATYHSVHDVASWFLMDMRHVNASAEELWGETGTVRGSAGGDDMMRWGRGRKSAK